MHHELYNQKYKNDLTKCPAIDVFVVGGDRLPPHIGTTKTNKGSQKNTQMTSPSDLKQILMGGGDGWVVGDCGVISQIIMCYILSYYIIGTIHRGGTGDTPTQLFLKSQKVNFFGNPFLVCVGRYKKQLSIYYLTKLTERTKLRQLQIKSVEIQIERYKEKI